jgi:hypothetical protein
MKKSTDINDLQSLPSITSDLHGQNPEKMYSDLCELRGQSIDRCVLYSFRCTVYAVVSNDDDPELRKWWNWKGRSL